jgi:hypothetical protein
MSGERWLLVVGFSMLGLTGLGTAYQIYLVSQMLVRMTELIKATH